VCVCLIVCDVEISTTRRELGFRGAEKNVPHGVYKLKILLVMLIKQNIGEQGM
jgi:hypothetical protein